MAEQAAPQGQAAPAAQPAPALQSRDMRSVPAEVARVQAILDSENTPPQEPAAQQQAQEQSTEPPAAQPEEEAPVGPNKQVEGDEAPAEDARRVAEIPLDQLEAIELEVTVKGEDGKDLTQKLPVKALKEGYMRQADYQRKTAEVARQRESVSESVRQAIEGDRKQYQATMQQLQALVMETVAPELQGVDLNKLATDDPFEYVKRRNRIDQINQTVTTIQAKQKEIADKHQAEQAQQRQKLADTARETLQADIPGWNDDLYHTLMKSSEKHGFKPEEVATWLDPRAIKLLHKAHMYDQLKANPQAPSAEKKVVVPPKVVRPGTAQATNQRIQQDQAGMKRLQGSGTITDAAAVIRSRMG